MYPFIEMVKIVPTSASKTLPKLLKVEIDRVDRFMTTEQLIINFAKSFSVYILNLLFAHTQVASKFFQRFQIGSL